LHLNANMFIISLTTVNQMESRSSYLWCEEIHLICFYLIGWNMEYVT